MERRSLVIREYNKRLVYQSVYWWLQYGGRSHDELQCVHEVPISRHCSICALKTHDGS